MRDGMFLSYCFTFVLEVAFLFRIVCNMSAALLANNILLPLFKPTVRAKNIIRISGLFSGNSLSFPEAFTIPSTLAVGTNPFHFLPSRFEPANSWKKGPTGRAFISGSEKNKI